MSDHPKEAERNLKPIQICDDTCLDVFRFLSPAKVGLELALVSHRFDALADAHFKYRKWTLGELEIYSENIYKTNDDGSVKELPFPQEPLPNSIVGFALVYIESMRSADAFAFLKCIGRLFESNVCLELYSCGGFSVLNTFATSNLLNVSGIIKLICQYSFDFQHFRRLISPSILCDCSNLRMIRFDNAFFFQFPPDDSEGSSDGQALCKWLHTPRADGQPKVLKYGWGKEPFPVDALKASFLNATTSVSFFLCLPSFSSSVGPFELVNSRTNEQLSSRRIEDNNYWWWLIERSPIDKSSEQWVKWEREAMDFEEFDRCKELTIFLD